MNDDNTKITNEFIQKLINDGFKKEQISEARMIGERLGYQLEQIVSQDTLVSTTPDIEDKDNKLKEEKAKYEALSKSFNICNCVELMLKLEKEFNGFSGVLNEYLLSLQIEVDLRKYLVDKKSYEKEKSDKMALVEVNSIITAEMIETKLLEKLQKNNKDVNAELDKQSISKEDKKTDGGQIDAINNTNLPKVENVVPPNPSEEINREIENIKKKSFGYSK